VLTVKEKPLLVNKGLPYLELATDVKVVGVGFKQWLCSFENKIATTVRKLLSPHVKR